MLRLIALLLVGLLLTPAVTADWAGGTVARPVLADPVSAGPGPVVLPPGEPRFPGHYLVWAKGSVIHEVDPDTGTHLTHDLSPLRIRWMLRTPYGFFLEVSRNFRAGTELAYYTGTELVPIRHSPARPTVSPDGRLAGWADRGGPPIKYGPSYRVVVVDLATGRRVFATTDDMGNNSDLYEELWAEVLGFDETYVYWQRVVGHRRRMRTDLTTWESSPASRMTADALERPIGIPWDTLSGWRINLTDGRPDWNGTTPGFVSPDGRWGFDLSTTGRLQVSDTVTGRRVNPQFGRRWRGFLGWQDPDTIYAWAANRYRFSYDPSHPDTTPVRLLACDLPRGECRVLRRLRGVERLVSGWGDW